MIPLQDLPRHSPHSAPFDFALLAAENTVADRLFRLRRSLRLSRADMAAKMGAAVRDYCDFEDGLAKPSTYELAALVVNFDGLSLNWLLKGQGLPFSPGREARPTMVPPSRVHRRVQAPADGDLPRGRTSRPAGRKRGTGFSPRRSRAGFDAGGAVFAIVTAASALFLFFAWGLQ